MKNFKISNKEIGNEQQPFIIAEAGINHNGDIALAKKMILCAKEAGVDAVKFQTFHADEFITDKSTGYTYQSQGRTITEPMLDMFQRTEFSEGEWGEIKKFCDSNGIVFLSTPQNESDLNLLLKLPIDAIKVGSDDFVNIPLIREYSKKGLPMMLSCGMADEGEIEETIQILHEYSDKPYVLFLCTSEYPTPAKDVNILKLRSLSEKYPDAILGLSDHTQGIEAAIMAVAMGARVFEKHFTLSHDLPGPDHWFSEDPESLGAWVKAIHTSYDMMGSAELKPTEKEMEMRKVCHRSITAIKNIKKNDLFTLENLALRRPDEGLRAREWDNVMGKRATRDIDVGSQLAWGDVKWI